MSAAGAARPVGLWSLRHRLVVAVAATLAVVLVGLAASGLLLRRTRDEQSRITVDYFAAYALAGEISQWLLDQESAVRGYALVREPSFPGQRVADPLADDGYRRVLASLREEPQTQERLEQAAASARRWQRDWVNPSLATLRRGEALPPAELIRGKDLSGAVRADVEAYVGSLLAVRESAVDALRRDTGLLFATVLAGVLGAVLAGVALLVQLARWVTAPVEELARQTRAVAGGDLGQAVAVAGPPEIVLLGRDVDGMRRELLTQLDGLKEAAEELEQSRRRLEEQATELKRSNTELEQFAYVASHDLQEPLRKVASFCQMLARRYEGQLDERADQYIAFAVDGAKRMQQLINDLLAFSRVGRIGGGPVDVDLETCLAAALRSLEFAREETGAQVTWDALPTVRGEAGLLTQVFQNLVGNAIKFRGEGAPRVHIGAVRRDGDWELSCHDDGLGIDEAYAERIFVLFQRLHAKDEYAGTGIGLALCRKIIEHHGGRIWLDIGDDDGARPRGTTFRWTIPVREGPAAGDEDGAVAAAVRGEVDE